VLPWLAPGIQPNNQDDERRKIMEGFCVTCVFNLKPEVADRMNGIIDSVYEKSLKERGCLEYRWYKSATNSSDFLLFMTWESESAFQEHVKTKHVSDVEEELKEVLQKPYQDMGWRFLDPER
jgi:quinol monooxygenase YgiN